MTTASCISTSEDGQALSPDIHALYNLIGTMDSRQLSLYVRLRSENTHLSYGELLRLYLEADAAIREVEMTEEEEENDDDDDKDDKDDKHNKNKDNHLNNREGNKMKQEANPSMIELAWETIKAIYQKARAIFTRV